MPCAAKHGVAVRQGGTHLQFGDLAIQIEPGLDDPLHNRIGQANSKEMSFAPSHRTAFPSFLRFESPEVSVIK